MTSGPLTLTEGPNTNDPAQSGLSAAQQKQVSNTLPGTNLPDDTAGGQFIIDEADAAKARGGGNPFQGFRLPNNVSATDYMALVSAATTFASNAGWKYFPTPVQLQWGLQHGLADLAAGGTGSAGVGSNALTQWFASLSGTATSIPWAANGMSKQAWDTNTNNINASVLDMTGQSSWAAAGLDPTMMNEAIAQSWSQSEISDHIMQNSTLAAKYGYLAQGLTYQSFQAYKSTNQATLQSRYGNGFTDQQAISNMQNPLTAFTAQGGATSAAQSKQALENAPGAGASSIR
jgi:hypothetical protein